MKKVTFIVSDESINKYGFRILTAGIDTTAFEKNPIMLYNHNRAWRGTTDEVLPIGRWENIRKEDGKLLMDAVFDVKDEFAKTIASKVEQGILNCTSVYIEPTATSSDAQYILQGQRGETVTESVLQEVSIVDIPGNANAARLQYSATGEQIDTEAAPLHNIKPLAPQSLNQKIDNMNENQLKTLAILLGLQEVATVEEVMAAANKLKADHLAVTQKLRAVQDEQDEAVLDEAILAGKITKDMKLDFKTLLTNQRESTLAVLKNMPKPTTLRDYAASATNSDADGTEKLKYEGMTFDELSKKAPAKLLKLKRENIELYKQLFQSEYSKPYKP